MFLHLYVLCTFAISVSSAASTCFGDLGCFSDHGLVPLPDSPAEIKTTYEFFSRQQSRAFSVSAEHIQTVSSAYFSNHRQTKMIIHGFNAHSQAPWVMDIKNNLLKKGDFNIILVDWSTGAKGAYSTSVADVYVVAAQTTKLIHYIQSHGGLTLSKLHIIGHSLGAHLAGEIGRMLGGHVGRISGLDPADPHFKDEPISRRLDKSDASFVDVIHSDGSGFIGISGYGLAEPCGHVDFYPNGGHAQPGCAESGFASVLGQIFGGNFNNIMDKVSCSHERACHLFAESIISACHFSAHPCSSEDDFDGGKCFTCGSHGCPSMGYDADQSSARGTFYLGTDGTQPFCGYEYFVEIAMASDMDTTYGEMFVTLYGAHRHTDELKFGHEMRYYRANDVDRHVLATHTNIGQLTHVRIRYKKDSTSHGEVKPHKITVLDVPSKRRVSFCNDDKEIDDGNTVSYTSTC